jgi:hypothetical protein
MSKAGKKNGKELAKQETIIKGNKHSRDFHIRE